MFVHHCTACSRRQLIFPSQYTGLAESDLGLVVAFTCWCGAEQTELIERRPAASDPRPVVAPAA